MRLSRLVFFVLTLFLMLETSTILVGQPVRDLSRRLLSADLANTSIPSNAKVRIKISWVPVDARREIQMILYPLDNGEVLAEWIVPAGEPLFDQIGTLRGMYDEASLDELLPFLAVDRTLVTSSTCVELENMVVKLEQITLPAITDEPFFAHANLYYLGIDYPYRSNRLEWFFRGDSNEGSSENVVPLLKWIEELAGTVEKCVVDQ